MKAAGGKIDNIALVHDNTEYGTSVAGTITTAFKEKGLNIALDVAYTSNATDVQSQVLQLKEKKPDVVIMISYTSDAILFAKTMQALDYKPPMLLADDAGYSDPSFIKAVGKISQGAFNRSSWSVGPPGSPTAHHRRACTRRRAATRWTTPPRARCRAFRAARCDRSRRLDRACKDPGGVEGDRPQARSAHDRLQGRQVRRQGPEYPGVRPASSSSRTARTMSRCGRRPSAEKAPVMPYKGW